MQQQHARGCGVQRAARHHHQCSSTPPQQLLGRSSRPSAQQQQQQQQPQRHQQQCPEQQQQQSSRRQLLQFTTACQLAGLLGAAVTLQPPAAAAAVTLTLRPKAKLVPFTTKAGYAVTVPDSWSLAYDRSTDSDKAGTQAFWGNFRTVETLAVLRTPKPEGDLTPQQLLSAVLAEQRNNQSTYGFELLSGDTPTQRTAPTTDGAGADTYFDAEYTLAICRGAIQEGKGGSRRCIGPRDMDLEVVSRTFYQTMTVRGDSIFIVRGSATAQQWEGVRAAAVEAVQSFRLPSAL